MKDLNTRLSCAKRPAWPTWRRKHKNWPASRMRYLMESLLRWPGRTLNARYFTWQLKQPDEGSNAETSVSLYRHLASCMNILTFTCCDWLPEQTRWTFLARSGLPAVSRKKKNQNPHNTSFIDQACSSRCMGYWPSVRSRWLNIGQVLFLRVFFYQDGVEVHKLLPKRTKPI